MGNARRGSSYLRREPESVESVGKPVDLGRNVAGGGFEIFMAKGHLDIPQGDMRLMRRMGGPSVPQVVRGKIVADSGGTDAGFEGSLDIGFVNAPADEAGKAGETARCFSGEEPRP